MSSLSEDHIDITSADVSDEETVMSCDDQHDRVASECTAYMPQEDHGVGPDASIQDIPDSNKTHTLISPPDKDLEEILYADTVPCSTWQYSYNRCVA